MNALDLIKSRFRQKALSIWHLGNRLVFRKSLALMRLSLSLLDAEIRRLDTSLLQIGEREVEDNVVEYVARELTSRPQIESAHLAVADMSDLAVSLSKKALADARVREVVGTYFLAKAYAFEFTHSGDEGQLALSTAGHFIPDAAALTRKDIYKIFAEKRRRIMELQSALAERSAIKFEIRAADVIAVLTIIPAVMFVAGLWYVTSLLGEFGIKASLTHKSVI